MCKYSKIGTSGMEQTFKSMNEMLRPIETSTTTWDKSVLSEFKIYQRK